MIVDYDPRWALMFAEERHRILQAIGVYVVTVEHVGSTAVPGLAAKPIIDLLVAVEHLSDAAACTVPLERLGYTYVPEFETEFPERRFFRKFNAEGRRTHHLYMVRQTSEFWARHILFRDYLRAHPDVARQYADLKRALAAQYSGEREAYTEGKTEFILNVLAAARRG